MGLHEVLPTFKHFKIPKSYDTHTSSHKDAHDLQRTQLKRETLQWSSQPLHFQPSLPPAGYLSSVITRFWRLAETSCGRLNWAPYLTTKGSFYPCKYSLVHWEVLCLQEPSVSHTDFHLQRMDMKYLISSVCHYWSHILQVTGWLSPHC